MKIAIIADTHDNLKNLGKALSWIKEQKISLILHCGDISNQETVDFIKNYFEDEVKYVKGNGDFNLDFPLELSLEIEGRRIGLNHYPEVAQKMCYSGKYDVVFYGHTHRPWDKEISGVHMINPGELAGQFGKPTFAVYDTATNISELKILERL